MTLFQSRLMRRARCVYVVAVLCALSAMCAQAAEKARMRVDDYQISAELLPETHKLSAHATVKVTALDDVSVASFQLNNALRITQIGGCEGPAADAGAHTQDSSIRFSLNSGPAKDETYDIRLRLRGDAWRAPDDSPVEGLKLAYVGPIRAIFCIRIVVSGGGYGANRFTATISVTVPAHMIAIGSGRQARRRQRPVRKRQAASSPDRELETFASSRTKPSFPGTIIAGTFEEYKSDEAGIGPARIFQAGAPRAGR